MGDPAKILDKNQKQRNALQKILSQIPGYRGYQEKERIRESDRLVREELFVHLRNAERNLDLAFVSAVEKGLPISNTLDKTKIRTDRIAEKIRHAEYGYAGVFDPVKIREDELMRMIDFDASLLERVSVVEKFTNELKKSNSSDASLSNSISELNTDLDDFEAVFAERRQILLGSEK